MESSRRVQLEIDHRLERVFRRAAALPALTDDARTRGERERMILALRRGEPFAPTRCTPTKRRVASDIWRALDAGRQMARAEGLPLYEDRFNELELELAIAEAMGHSKRLRPLTMRRYGSANAEVSKEEMHAADGIAASLGYPTSFADQSLLAIATRLLEVLPPQLEEARTVPGVSSEHPSMTDVVLEVARAAGLSIAVRVEPSLLSRAAAGGRTVFLASGEFGARESRRLAVHEVFGHLAAAANGRAQAFGIFTHGTARSFADQEGVAIELEDRFGLLDIARVRVIAARVLATEGVQRGAPFAEVAFTLLREFGFSPRAAIVICERAYRGGGIARDAIYLRGWLRVRGSSATLDELRVGKVGVDDLPLVREWLAQGRLRPARFGTLSQEFASLSRSRASTQRGTSPVTSPPKRATSLTSRDAT